MDKVGFIDEYGDKSIEYQKSGVSIYFIVTAIIVDKENITTLENKIKKITSKFTQAPEIKSNAKIFQDIDKRIAFLEQISLLDFKVYSVIVDKRKVFEDSGLKFRNTFFKYVNNLLDSDLYRYFPFIELVSDEHGTDKFMNGFIEYVNQNHFQTDLFRKPLFRFGDSKNEPLIQLADFISGTLARCYEPAKIIDNPNRIIEILKDRILHLREWPETSSLKYKLVNDIDNLYDSKIADFSLSQIAQFVNENEHKNDDQVKNQLICLHYLVFKFRINPYAYIYSDEIIERINIRGVDINKRLFTKDIIGKLREKGLLIVSSQSGYKIPCSEADLIHFFNNYNTKIFPMLRTLEQYDVLIKLATEGLINLLNHKEFELNKKLIAVMKSRK
ncbi:MAG TPA: DUF3800 domain-containing protein [Ferruginibacter sp.]|nr:DUF3800 domain-containing protein [Ferruginibacter sp.]